MLTLCLWCITLVVCAADQATFTNITDVQVAPDTNATVIKQVAVWMDPGFSDGLFDSCKVRRECVESVCLVAAEGFMQHGKPLAR